MESRLTVRSCEASTITWEYKERFSDCFPSLKQWADEALNMIIKHNLKAKLEDNKGSWLEELPKVLWSYNTTLRSTTRESPYVLANLWLWGYGSYGDREKILQKGQL